MPQTKKPKPVERSDPAPGMANGPFGDVLTLAEAAAYLRLPENDVVQTIHEQGLPARQIGTEWRFFKTAIQNWLSTGSPNVRSSKDALLAGAGTFKDDPDLDAIVKEAMHQRGRSQVEG